jgi:hypothetical protein
MAGLGWREALLAAIALLVLYLLLVVVRLLRLRPAATPPSHEAAHHIDAIVGDDDDDDVPESVTNAAAQAAPPTQPTVRYVEHRHLDPIEHDLADLRADVQALRRELQQLRGDVQGQVERLRAAQSTSPLYSDAMQLAQLGYDANAIAERCGVAIAEAELVVALANSHRSQGVQ